MKVGSESTPLSLSDSLVKLDVAKQKQFSDIAPEISHYSLKRQERRYMLIGSLALIIIISLVVLVFSRTNKEENQLLFAPLFPSATFTPTLTSTATSTPTLTTTPTPTPTQTLTPTPLPPAGIGVSRNTIQAVFTNLGFTFHEADALYNQPRMIGISIDKTITIELSGPPPELIKVTLYMGDSYVGDQALISQVYMQHLLKIITPQWKEGQGWLTQTLKQINGIKNKSIEKETFVELIKVTLQTAPSTDLIQLSLEGIYSLESK